MVVYGCARQWHTPVLHAQTPLVVSLHLTLHVASLDAVLWWYIYLWAGILHHAMVTSSTRSCIHTDIHSYPLVHSSGIRVHGWYIGIVLLQGILYMHTSCSTTSRSTYTYTLHVASSGMLCCGGISTCELVPYIL